MMTDWDPTSTHPSENRPALTGNPRTDFGLHVQNKLLLLLLWFLVYMREEALSPAWSVCRWDIETAMLTKRTKRCHFWALNKKLAETNPHRLACCIKAICFVACQQLKTSLTCYQLLWNSINSLHFQKYLAVSVFGLVSELIAFYRPPMAAWVAWDYIDQPSNIDDPAGVPKM